MTVWCRSALYRLSWPRSTVEKGPQRNESYERRNPWNRTISTVLWVHRKLPQSTVKLVLPSNESYESKTGYNRTPATVLWVPLIQINVLSRKSCTHSKWCRRYTPPLVALQGVATPLSRLFQQFRGCRRGVAATPPTPSKGPVAPHPGPPRSTHIDTVRAETITELFLDRGGPMNFKDFFWLRLPSYSKSLPFQVKNISRR